MDPALQALLTATVTIAPYTGQDAYGKAQYGPAQTVPARVQFRLQRLTDATGQERVSRAKVFVDGDVTLDLRDRVTLPDGTMPPILTLYKVSDLDGAVSHWETFF